MLRHTHCWVLAGVCLTAACSPERTRAAAGLTAAEVDTLAHEMIARGERGQALRGRDYLAEPGSTRAALMAEWRATDSSNAAWLAALVDRIGWPGRTRFGDRAATAAFLIVQFADRDSAFQAEFLPVLREAAERGEASKRDVAFLTDRIRVREGRPQVYGTQYDVEPGEDGRPRYLLPIVEDRTGLDARRAEAGLQPWAEFEAQMAEIQGRPPAPRPREPGDG